MSGSPGPLQTGQSVNSNRPICMANGLGSRGCNKSWVNHLSDRFSSNCLRSGSDELQLQTSFGIPIPHLDAPITSTDYLSTVFSEEVTAGLLNASRKHGPKLFSMQIASIIVTCLRINRVSQDLCEQRVILPYIPVNLRPILSKNGSSEIVSAVGSNILEISDISKYYPVKDDEETVAAVWAIAQDLQEQLVMQKSWECDVSKSAPIFMKTLMEKFVGSKPP